MSLFSMLKEYVSTYIVPETAKWYLFEGEIKKPLICHVCNVGNFYKRIYNSKTDTYDNVCVNCGEQQQREKELRERSRSL